jgi:hypothetical protein
MKRKPNISVEECCKEFYDKNIFHAIIAGIDGWSMLLGTRLKFVTEADTSFSSIDPDLFRQEMTAVRMEVFALAFARKVKREDLMQVQSFFTWCYLEENGKLDIWDIMGEYNKIIALSAVTDTDGHQMSNKHVMKINMLRAEAMKKWVKTNVNNPDSWTDDENKQAICGGRVIMRLGADIKREDFVAPKMLACKLADRLGRPFEHVKDEAIVRLWFIIRGFYEGAEEYLKSISL